MNALKKISFYFLRCTMWSSLFLVNSQLQGMEQKAAAQENDTQTKARHAADLELIKVLERGYLNFCDLDLIKRLLLAGANIDAQDGYGNTALIVAAHNRQFEIMRFLLNPSDVWYDTLAEQWVDAPIKVCKFACNFAPSADPNLMDEAKNTALHYVLLDWRGDNGFDSGSDEYCYDYDYEVYKHEAIKLLIDAGADVNLVIRWYGTLASTPLIEAVREEEITIVQLLLDAGANPFAKIDDQTALDFATQKKDYEIISKKKNAEIISLLKAQEKWIVEHPDLT